MATRAAARLFSMLAETVGRRPRPGARGWLVFSIIAGVALLGVALTAVAAQEGDPLPIYERGGAKPSGFDAASGPFVGGRGREQFAEAVERMQERERARAERLASPKARQEREDSRTAFLGLSDGAAVGLLQGVFADELRGTGGLDFEDVADGRRVEAYLDDHTVVLAGDGDRPQVLVQSPAPARTRGVDGEEHPVDLSLERVGDGFAPANAVADVAVPGQLAEGVDVGDVGVVPEGAAQATVSDDGDHAVYPNAQVDTDVVVKPVTAGAEVFWQLRSVRSPEELVLDLRMPKGAIAQAASDGQSQVTIVKDDRPIATVSAPTAVDAQGEDVPVAMEVRGERVVLSVAHRSEDVQYPILVDPVIEDWFNYGSWYFQTDWALNELAFWSNTQNGVAANVYAPRYDCAEELGMGCFKWDANAYNFAKNDGLHYYIRGNTSYPAWSNAYWFYQPPGTTTRVVNAQFGVKYLRQNSGASRPYMFTGIWRPTYGDWLGLTTFNSNVSNHWNNTTAGSSAAGPQQVAFGFATLGNVTPNVWNQGYMGAAIIELTDLENPAFASTGLKRLEVGADGVTPGWVDRSTSQWVKPGDELALRPRVTDSGLGVKKVQVNGPGIVDAYDSECEGVRSDPCSNDWTLSQNEQLGFTVPTSMPDGNNAFTLYAWDAIARQGSSAISLKVDSQTPVVNTPTGDLWDAKEEEPTPPGGQDVLSPGTHSLTVSADDPAPGGSPPGLVRSGVEKIEVKVDGQTEGTVSQGACPAGNCSRSLTWSYNTADMAGRHSIQIVATDGAGNVGRRTFAINTPATGELLTPIDGEITSSKLALQAKGNDGAFTGVKFQYRKRPIGAWTTINLFLTDEQGNLIFQDVQPLSEPGQKTKKLIWDVRTLLHTMLPVPAEIQVRASFVGGAQEVRSAVANVDLDEKGLSAGNAETTIGPGSIDLLAGSFSYSASDASLASFGGPIALTRSFNSRNPNANAFGPFGPGWVASAPVDGVSDYSSLVVLTDSAVRDWVDVFDSSGQRIRFEKTGNTTFKPEVGFEALTLTRVPDPVPGQPDKYTLTDLDGVVTTFVKLDTTSKFVPSKVEQPGSQGTTGYSYEAYNGEPRIKRVIAPTAGGLNCTATTPDRGCRVLQFNYSELSIGNRLTSISHIAWNPATSSMSTDSVAEFWYFGSGTSAGRLAQAFDPRITPNLKETYTYDLAGRLTTIAPPGEAGWSIAYEAGDDSKLASVSRTASGSGTESWRMTWGVPLSAPLGPYNLTATDLNAWGQTDRPTDATAILPPDQSGGGYSRATVYYLDQDGRVVNTALPGGRIATSEYDAKGNVVRELSAANRARALAVGGGSATLAGLLSTYSTYSADGLELVDELGPQHQVKLDSGAVVGARAHTTTAYDEGSTLASDKAAHLPTTVTTGAQVGPSDPDEDVRVTKTEYDWTLRRPTKTIVDAVSGGLNITHRTDYNAAGLEVASRQPKSDGTDAGTTKTLYYTHDGSSPDAACRNRPEWFNLPCKTMPATQPGVSGLPDLPVTTSQYNRYGEPTTTTETVGSVTRTTTTTYDSAGRKLTDSVAGGGSGGPSGLVAAYGFDEGAGSVAADSSGSGNTGTISGATWVSSGRYGKALDFDGTNDWVTVPDASSLDLAQGLTLSAWVKPDDTSGAWQAVIFKERGSGDGSYVLYGDTDSELAGVGLHAADTWHETRADDPLENGEWAHIAATSDGQTIKFYVDGQLASSTSMNGSILTSNDQLRIGGNAAWSEFFDGQIDEVRIYDRALSVQEIGDDRDTSVASQTASPTGVAVPTTTYGYNSTTGRPTTVATPDGTIATTYDNVGRPTSYTDADGNTSTTGYDNLNRPTTTSDGKGTQTRAYDSQTGLLASLTDSQAGQFTAAYDADGNIVSKTYPNGMTAATTYDESGSPVRLAYTKTSNCSSGCTWIDEQVSESIDGQWRTHSWELSSQEYSYDKAGRLTNVVDDVAAPAAVEGCTIRSYAFDEDSNRTSMTVKAPGSGGACDPGATATQKTYSYDTADRLTATGTTYDPLGRMTHMPAEHAGGGALTYTYYVNDQVRTISQDGVSKTYALDPAGRQHQTIAQDGTTHTETLHYQDSSDSPAWTTIKNTQGQEISWERTTEGIDGDLAATTTHTAQGDTTILQLSNLHGDTIATASTNPQATTPTNRFETDEFGNPRQTNTRRYGWLGGKQRRTELASGVIQMGVRSYVPALGRFTSVDPIAGGSASDYDYAGTDPVNNLDLDGRRCIKMSTTHTHIPLLGDVPTGVKATVCSNKNKGLRKIVNSDAYGSVQAIAEAACDLIPDIVPPVVKAIAKVGCTYIVQHTFYDVRTMINQLGKRHCLFAEWGLNNVRNGDLKPHWGSDKPGKKKCRRR